MQLAIISWIERTYHRLRRQRRIGVLRDCLPDGFSKADRLLQTMMAAG